MELSDANNWVFLVLAAVMVAAGLRVVTTPNVVHAALMLVVTLAGTAAMMLLLGAEFLAWVIVLIYIGAVVVLFLFGVMITRSGIRGERLDYRRRWPAAVVAIATFALLSWSSLASFDDVPLNQSQPVRTRDLSAPLFDRFVVPFEAVSFVLLAALIGGIVLARRDRESQ